ncbi:MAG: hypothetical protein ABIJ34_07165 [archaeon]
MVSNFVEINNIPLEELVVMAGLRPKRFLRMDNPLIGEIPDLKLYLPYKTQLIQSAIDVLQMFKGEPGTIAVLCTGAEPLGNAIRAVQIYSDNERWQQIDIKYIYANKTIVGNPNLIGPVSLQQLRRVIEQNYVSPGTNTYAQILSYLRELKVFNGKHVVFADTGAYASVPDLIYKLLAESNDESIKKLEAFLIFSEFSKYGTREIPLKISRAGKAPTPDCFVEFVMYLDHNYPHSRPGPSKLIKNGRWVPNTDIYHGQQLEMYLAARFIIENSAKEYFKGR